MIIQCEQCSTKFRLDDSKVTEKGVKVRCAKCRHVFSVKKDVPDTEIQTDLDAMLAKQSPDFGAMLDEKVSVPIEQESSSQSELKQDDSLLPSATNLDDMFSEPNPDFGTMFDEGISPKAEQESSAQPLLIKEEAPLTSSADFGGMLADPPPDEDAMFDDRMFIQTEQEPPPQPDLKEEYTSTSPSSVPDFDYSDFDFSGKENVPDLVMLPPQEDLLQSPVADNEEPALFSLDEEQGLALKHKETQDDPTAAPPYTLGDLDLNHPADVPATSGMEFDDTFDFGAFQADIQSVEVSATPLPEKEADVFPVGIMVPLTVEPVVVEVADSVAALAAPVGEAQAEPVVTDETTAQERILHQEMKTEEELPPLTIASRRKQNSRLGILLAVAAIVIVAVIGYFYYAMMPEDKGKVSVESGKITLGSVNAKFVKNRTIGDLLVITGEAVNKFARPRAAIQVKGMVYGAKGEVLVSKNAYCGNPLTTEQLSTLPLDKIEAAMANQFGDSLANMEVSPGKAIPFVLVIANPSIDGKDYGVEPVGSTVAAGKQ